MNSGGVPDECGNVLATDYTDELTGLIQTFLCELIYVLSGFYIHLC